MSRDKFRKKMEDEIATLRAENAELKDKIEGLRSELATAYPCAEDAILKVEELEAALARVTAERDKAVDALSMTLPMARGYAHEHNVGGNQGKISFAEEVLEETETP